MYSWNTLCTVGFPGVQGKPRFVTLPQMEKEKGGRGQMGSRQGIYNQPPVYISWGRRQVGSRLGVYNQLPVLNFKIEITTGTGWIARLCLLRTLDDNSLSRDREAKPHLSRRSSGHIFPLLGARETLHRYRKGSLGVKKEGAPSHNMWC